MMPKMKLSDAILNGCKKTSQCYGRMYARDEDGRITGACALGAAAIGLGYQDKTGSGALARLKKDYPFLVDGPVFEEDITYENDVLRTPREEIAVQLARQGL